MIKLILIICFVIESAYADPELPSLDFDVALIEPQDDVSEFEEISDELSETATHIKDLNREVIVGEFKSPKSSAPRVSIDQISSKLNDEKTNEVIPKYKHEAFNANMPPLPSGSRYVEAPSFDSERWQLPQSNAYTKSDRFVTGDAYVDRRISVYKRDLPIVGDSRRTFEVRSKQENYFDFPSSDYQRAIVPNVKIFLNEKP